MYLEILTVANLGGGTTSEVRVFVGPFENEDARLKFREHWEGQLNSNEHNPNQVKFLSQDCLPKSDWSPVPPDEFRGFLRAYVELPGEE
jgi:hypothetical protein